MNYNHGSAEKKEAIRIAKEDEILKECHVSNKIKEEIRKYDRYAFNKERRYYEKQVATADAFFINKASPTPKKEYTITNFFDDFENESLVVFIKSSPKDMLHIFFLLSQDYTFDEIAKILGIKTDTLRKRVNRYAKKNKKMSNFDHISRLYSVRVLSLYI